jgi:hypothetical protein
MYNNLQQDTWILDLYCAEKFTLASLIPMTVDSWLICGKFFCPSIPLTKIGLQVSNWLWIMQEDEAVLPWQINCVNPWMLEYICYRGLPSLLNCTGTDHPRVDQVRRIVDNFVEMSPAMTVEQLNVATEDWITPPKRCEVCNRTNFHSALKFASEHVCERCKEVSAGRFACAIADLCGVQ